MFPLVMIVVNVASVGVIWFGGQRVDNGQMEVGALTAYLSYLMQILMSVMMATFMLMQVPRSAVCADRIAEVLDTDSSVVPSADPVPPDPARRGHLDLEDVTFAYPGAEAPVLRRGQPERPAGADRWPSSAPPAPASRPCSTSCRACSTPPRATVRVAGVVGPRPRPRAAVGRRSGWCRRRPSSSPARSRTTCARQARRHRGRDVGGPRDRPGPRLRRGHARRSRRRDRPGRHELLRRPAPAHGDRPRGRPAPGDLPLRRLVLRPRPRHRRAAARRAGAGHDATRRWWSSPSGSRRSATPTGSW